MSGNPDRDDIRPTDATPDIDTEQYQGFEDFAPRRGEQRLPQDEPLSLAMARYPLNTQQGIRTAWNYINNEQNAMKYDPAEVEQYKERIQMAARQMNVQIGGS